MERKKVLVIGGGTAGMTSALDLAERGVEVYLVEKEKEIGGRAGDYCCKATESCNRCAACLVLQQKDKVTQEPLVHILTSAQVNAVKRNGKGFQATVARGEDVLSLEVQAVIVATGFDPYDLKRRSEFAYGLEENVISGLELEKALKEKGSFVAAFGSGIKKIGFIQCVGSRDLSIGNGYCSRVCCMYAAKLAKLIRSELPEVEIDIFYMDFQSFGKGFSIFTQELRETDKIKFIRAIPSKIYGFPYDRLTVRYTDSLVGKPCEEKYDLIVLSLAITPAQGSQELAQQLGIALDNYGFMAGRSDQETVATNQPGIFLAGVCQGPKDIPQTIGHARAAAGAAYQYLTS
ncbi:MAG: CoB--CoM heterodisulfide reductase iron-sulfur subunit A family protein [Firmicutes bacterium]|nr:CoB--CoM heterodisulfide reductase iron-sulfur subunit A family protein [Bacillota bacterium]